MQLHRYPRFSHESSYQYDRDLVFNRFLLGKMHSPLDFSTVYTIYNFIILLKQITDFIS